MKKIYLAIGGLALLVSHQISCTHSSKSPEVTKNYAKTKVDLLTALKKQVILQIIPAQPPSFTITLVFHNHSAFDLWFNSRM